MSTHSIHAIPHSIVKRQLIVKKIAETPDNKSLYKSAISSLFENPANFFETTYKDHEDFTEKDAIMYTKNWIEYEKAEKPEGVHTWQLVHYYFRFK